MHQLREFGAGRCLDTAEPGRPTGTIDVDTVQEQHKAWISVLEAGYIVHLLIDHGTHLSPLEIKSGQTIDREGCLIKHQTHLV